MKKTTVKKGSLGKKAAVGVGIAALAAAGVGAYLLTGSKNAAKNRKQAKAWAQKAQKEVITQVGKLKTVNEETYGKVVKEVSARYKKLKKLDPKDVKEFAEELHGYWKMFSKEMKGASKAGMKAAKVVAKKASKKK